MLFSDYGPVVSFEPLFHKIVELNVKSNALRYGVQVIPCALSDEQTVSKIHVPSQGVNQTHSSIMEERVSISKKI
jgi:hypothetical protein